MAKVNGLFQDKQNAIGEILEIMDKYNIDISEVMDAFDGVEEMYN